MSYDFATKFIKCKVEKTVIHLSMQKQTQHTHTYAKGARYKFCNIDVWEKNKLFSKRTRYTFTCATCFDKQLSSTLINYTYCILSEGKTISILLPNILTGSDIVYSNLVPFWKSYTFKMWSWLTSNAFK